MRGVWLFLSFLSSHVCSRLPVSSARLFLSVAAWRRAMRGSALRRAPFLLSLVSLECAEREEEKEGVATPALGENEGARFYSQSGAPSK